MNDPKESVERPVRWMLMRRGAGNGRGAAAAAAGERWSVDEPVRNFVCEA